MPAHRLHTGGCCGCQLLRLLPLSQPPCGCRLVAVERASCLGLDWHAGRNSWHAGMPDNRHAPSCALRPAHEQILGIFLGVRKAGHAIMVERHAANRRVERAQILVRHRGLRGERR